MAGKRPGYPDTLTGAVPTAANAAYYAEIVAEKAVLRRLVEAGTRIVQLGYGGSEGQVGGSEVDQIVDRAQAEIYEVTQRRTAEDYVVLEDLLQPTMDEMDAIASRGGLAAGVPTGFADLDSLTNGFHPGQMIIMAARPGIGKSTFALDVARNASVKHRLTLTCSSWRRPAGSALRSAPNTPCSLIRRPHRHLHHPDQPRRSDLHTHLHRHQPGNHRHQLVVCCPLI